MNSSCWQLDKYARLTSASANGRENDSSWQVIYVKTLNIVGTYTGKYD